MVTCHTMDRQAHTIGKAIRPLFADLVSYLHAEKIQNPSVSL